MDRIHGVNANRELSIFSSFETERLLISECPFDDYRELKRTNGLPSISLKPTQIPDLASEADSCGVKAKDRFFDPHIYFSHSVKQIWADLLGPDVGICLIANTDRHREGVRKTTRDKVWSAPVLNLSCDSAVIPYSNNAGVVVMLSRVAQSKVFHQIFSRLGITEKRVESSKRSENCFCVWVRLVRFGILLVSCDETTTLHGLLKSFIASFEHMTGNMVVCHIGDIISTTETPNWKTVENKRYIQLLDSCCVSQMKVCLIWFFSRSKISETKHRCGCYEPRQGCCR